LFVNTYFSKNPNFFAALSKDKKNPKVPLALF